jgi:hypothetical protein
VLKGTVISTAPVLFSIGVVAFFFDLQEANAITNAPKMTPERIRPLMFAFMVLKLIFEGKIIIVFHITKAMPKNLIIKFECKR